MSIAENREDGGKLVRRAWISWAAKQPDPKPSWLVTWDELPEQDKEADRIIWDHITAPYLTKIARMQDEIRRLRQENDQWRDEQLQNVLNKAKL